MYAEKGWEVLHYILGKNAINPDYDYTLKMTIVPAVAYGKKQTCLSGNKDHNFIKDYMTKMYGKKGTIPYNEVFTADDFVDGKMPK